MDMPAPPPADGAGGGNTMETHTFQEVDDDAFLGLNHQQFPEMDGVSVGGDPLRIVQEASSVFRADW